MAKDIDIDALYEQMEESRMDRVVETLAALRKEKEEADAKRDDKPGAAEGAT